MLAPRSEPTSCKLGELPGASDRDKIEVWSRTGEDGTSLLELVEYSWGSGIGWYVQKRLTLEAGQVEALRALVGAAEPALPAPRLRPPTAAAVREGNTIRLSFAANQS
jgi:hypothetical protein